MSVASFDGSWLFMVFSGFAAMQLTFYVGRSTAKAQFTPSRSRHLRVFSVSSPLSYGGQIVPPWISPLITTTMGLLGLYFTVRHFKIVRTVSYIERMNHPNMAEVRTRVDQWLDSGRTDEERLRELQEDFALRARVRMFYNMITELAIAYRYRTISRKLTLEIWDPLVPEYWEKMQFHIQDTRAKGVSVGHNFEYLANEFHKSRRNPFTFHSTSSVRHGQNNTQSSMTQLTPNKAVNPSGGSG
ncbi:MAG: hypothetical protein ACKV2Q_36805 [Planctomycetaceae bacterium]